MSREDMESETTGLDNTVGNSIGTRASETRRVATRDGGQQPHGHRADYKF